MPVERVRGSSLFRFELARLVGGCIHRSLTSNDSLVFVVRPDPKPIQDFIMFASQCTPATTYANRPVFALAFKPQRRMAWISPPQLICLFGTLSYSRR